MQVVFYTFSKRVNSTARPTGGASYSCILKSPSSVIAPQISLVWQGSGNPSAYNYAYIADFGRYYWVRNWAYGDRQWMADLTVDVLASWKTEIGSAEKYVLRAASEENKHVIDTMYPAQALAKSYGDVQANGFTSYGAGSGVYVVTVAGDNDTTGNGTIAQFQLTGEQLQEMIRNMMHAIEGTFSTTYNSAGTLTDREAWLQLLKMPFRMVSDVSAYLKSVMWFPVSFTTGDTTKPVYLGPYLCLNSAPLITTPVWVSNNIDFNVTGYPYGSDPDWEWSSPLASYSIEWEPFGTIPIDSNDVIASTVLRCLVKVDALSGLAILRIYSVIEGSSVSPRLLATRTAQVGVEVPYGGTSPNYAGAITGAVGIATAAAALYTGEAGAGALAGAIGNAIASSAPTGYVSGTSGGGASVEPWAFLWIRKLDHVSIDPTECGYPLCEIRTLNTLSGYVQTRDGDISAPATAQELSEIESYLTGGFFYE